MFDNFFNFVKLPVGKEITSVVTFLSSVSGLSFFDGLFRFFNEEQKNKWEKIVTEYYIDYLGKIEVVCYDWLGRVFALSDDTNTVIFFEPGTGKVYDTDAGIEKFFDYVVIEYTNDCFALDFFKEWFESTEGYQLLNSECASYKIPLFLNGADSVENLDVCDMEVHWEIMRVTHNLND